jgi:hypothetical protein
MSTTPKTSNTKLIAAKITEAEQLVDRLEKSGGPLAAAWATEQPGAQAALERHQAELVGARDRLVFLKQALAESQRQDKIVEQQRLTSIVKAQYSTVRTKLKKREEAGERLAAAIGSACQAWQELVDLSAEARAVPVLGLPYQSWATALTDIETLGHVTAWEMFRSSADIVERDPLNGQALALPGGRPDALQRANLPRQIVPLVDRLKDAGAHVLTLIKSHVERIEAGHISPTEMPAYTSPKTLPKVEHPERPHRADPNATSTAKAEPLAPAPNVYSPEGRAAFEREAAMLPPDAKEKVLGTIFGVDVRQEALDQYIANGMPLDGFTPAEIEAAMRRTGK